MIALLAFAMIGCPTKESDSDSDSEQSEEPDNRIVISYPETATKSNSGIYEAKILKQGLSTGTDWGKNDDGHTLKVVFVTTEVAQAIIDGEIASDEDLFTDDNNCYVYCNNDIGNGYVQLLANNATEEYAEVVGVNAKYDGLLISKEDSSGDYTILLDVNRIEKSQLMIKTTDETTDGVEAISDLADRIPLFIGSIAFNQSKANGIKAPFSFWSSAVLMGVPSTKTWPTSIKERDALDRRTFADITHIVGTVEGWQHTALVNGKFEFTADAEVIRFKFSCGDWSFQAGTAETVNWTEGNDAGHNFGSTLGTSNLKIQDNAPALLYTVEVGKTYVITYAAAADGSSATCTVAEKQGGSNPPAPTTYDITIAEVDAADGEVSISGATEGKAAEGTEITITATAATGKTVDTISVKDAENADVTVTENKFTMPAKAVTITVTFKDE